MPKPTSLGQTQIDEFIQRGSLLISDCFSREAAQEITDRAYIRLGYDKNDSATWEKSRVHMPSLTGFDCATFAPKAWAAIGDLLGGFDRIHTPCSWSDALIVNFSDGAGQPWQEPAASVGGWHKDGDFFRHYLDSPEQGLLVLVLWSDIGHEGGGTFIAPDSLAPVARFFAAHPEGVLPNEIPFRPLIDECREFAEITGKVGDVILCHPFLLHASSRNKSGIPRFLTNPPVSLREPMRFDRAQPDEFSPVERVVLNALGTNHFAFNPTGSRERIVPERAQREMKEKEIERERLAKNG